MPVFNKLRKGDKRSIGHLRSRSNADDPSSPVLGSSGAGYGNEGYGGDELAHPTVVRAPQDSNSQSTFAPTSDPELLHIRLKQEADERARRTSGAGLPSNTSNNTNANLGTSPTNTRSSEFSPSLYDGQSVYNSSGERAPGGNHRRAASDGNSAVGNANAGWYMTTGVLPASVPRDPDDPARSRKYDSIYRATGLASSSPSSERTIDRNTSQRTNRTSGTSPSSAGLGPYTQRTSSIFKGGASPTAAQQVQSSSSDSPDVLASPSTRRSSLPLGPRGARPSNPSSAAAPTPTAPLNDDRDVAGSSATPIAAMYKRKPLPPLDITQQEDPAAAQHPKHAARRAAAISASSPTQQPQFQQQQQSRPRTSSVGQQPYSAQTPVGSLPNAAMYRVNQSSAPSDQPMQTQNQNQPPQSALASTTVPVVEDAPAIFGSSPRARGTSERERERGGPPPAFQWRGADGEELSDDPDQSPQQTRGGGRSRFTEQMDIVGRKSEDTPRGLAMTSGGLSSQGRNEGIPSRERGDGLTASEIQDERAAATRRGDMDPQGVPTLPAERGEDLTASQIQQQRELQGEAENQPRPPVAMLARGGNDYNDDDDDMAREERDGVAALSPPLDPRLDEDSDSGDRFMTPYMEVQTPAVAFPTPAFERKYNDNSPFLPREQQASTTGTAQNATVTRTPTYGPSQETSRTTEPRVVGSQTQRYLDQPEPSMSYPAPNHPQAADLFKNVAQAIPHYMFVRYEAEVCQECVASEQRMHSLRHGGEGWRYDYADPAEEGALPSDDPNTSKTGRREFSDKVSLLPSTSGANGGSCQCEGCLKNRELVKFAAENGLIEEIFEGRRHPKSETIETITYTTIVRAPIIEETVTTVWCDEPNCAECQLKDDEYREGEYRALVDSMPGMVLHETEQSDKYTGKDIWGLRGAVDDVEEGQEATSQNRLNMLLRRAGNPEMERIRSMSDADEGYVIGGEDAMRYATVHGYEWENLGVLDHQSDEQGNTSARRSID